MIGHIDDGLVALIADKLDFVLDRQDSLRARTAHVLLTGHIPHPHLDGTRESLLTIRTAILEQQCILAIALDCVGPIKDALPPAVHAAMERIGAVILGQLVVAAIEIVNNTILNAVGDATNGGAEVGRVVFDVVILGREAEHDVLVADAELLDDGAEGEEGEG